MSIKRSRTAMRTRASAAVDPIPSTTNEQPRRGGNGVVRFDSAVRVKPGLHIQNYTPEERAACWYQRAEYKTIQQALYMTLDFQNLLLVSSSSSSSPTASTATAAALCTRGLEHIACSSEGGGTKADSIRTRQRVIGAVLDAQDQQYETAFASLLLLQAEGQHKPDDEQQRWVAALLPTYYHHYFYDAERLRSISQDHTHDAARIASSRGVQDAIAAGTTLLSPGRAVVSAAPAAGTAATVSFSSPQTNKRSAEIETSVLTSQQEEEDAHQSYQESLRATRSQRLAARTVSSPSKNKRSAEIEASVLTSQEEQEQEQKQHQQQQQQEEVEEDAHESQQEAAPVAASEASVRTALEHHLRVLEHEAQRQSEVAALFPDSVATEAAATQLFPTPAATATPPATKTTTTTKTTGTTRTATTTSAATTNLFELLDTAGSQWNFAIAA